MYIVNLTYKKPILEVEKHLEAHRAFLDRYYDEGHFLCSGRKEPRTGGVIIAFASSVEELEAVVRQDPFYTNGVTDYQLIEFIPNKYREELAQLLSSTSTK